MVYPSIPSNDTTSAETARIARERLVALIERGRARGEALVAHVESMQPRDLLVPAEALQFTTRTHAPGRICVGTAGTAIARPFVLHPFALGQAADRAGLPRAYLTRLMEPANAAWGPALAVANLNRLYAAEQAQRLSEADDTGAYLLRTVRPEGASHEEARGFLSSRFRRLDSRPIVAAFCEACRQVGAVPVDGHITDTRIALKAVLAKIYEPVRNEVMVFGMALLNSDYGNGALEVSFYAVRLACTNGLLLEKALRRVHLGSRLAPGVAWSAQTLAADTEATASAVHDLVRTRLNERNVRHLADAIRAANEQAIEPKQASEILKKHLLKTEVEAVTAAFNAPDVVSMPPGMTRWRLANAVSWIAGRTDDAERSLELQRVAGSLLPVREVE